MASARDRSIVLGDSESLGPRAETSDESFDGEHGVLRVQLTELRERDPRNGQRIGGIDLRDRLRAGGDVRHGRGDDQDEQADQPSIRPGPAGSTETRRAFGHASRQ